MKHTYARLPLRWTVGHAAAEDTPPERFVAATVPGAVQLDLARALKYPDYRFADNFRMFGWMEACFHTYRAEFETPVLGPGQRLRFVSLGIDYRFEVRINGKRIHSQEGMFTPVDCDLTEQLSDRNTLEVVVWPAPKRHAAPADRTQASHVTKPAVSYGWDWHPRLIPLGIWDETWLEIRPQAHVRDVHVAYTLSDAFDRADISLTAEAEAVEGHSYVWTLTDDTGRCVLRSEGVMSERLKTGLTLEHPRLWWTHDHGEPRLYESRFDLFSPQGELVQQTTHRVGFRRIRLVMNEGAWDEPHGFPKSRSVSPAQIELNGRRIFAKGSNWVSPDIFPGVVTTERYRELIEMARDAHFNLLRMWGGSPVSKEAFFDLCDRYGILVWQEFPLACNCYPDDPGYLRTLEREATAILRRLRRHACLAIWCGGNELFNSWSGMTEQSLALRMLDALCLKYDPHTPFNFTSPLSGMAHGHYVFRWEGREVYQTMQASRHTAYTEFGIPGLAAREVLERIIPQQELFPPRPGTAWESHHAFGAWDGYRETWLEQSLLTEYMGSAESLDRLVEQSQLLQSEGYKAIFEEARRQKPYCAMALNWCFNEPWPTAANNSLVSWPATAKPALQAVAGSCRPLCASGRIGKFVWYEEELFEMEVWLLNDRYESFDGLHLTVSLHAEEATHVILAWDAPRVEANTNLAGPTARFRLPGWQTDRFDVAIDVTGRPELAARYTLMYRQKAREKAGTKPLNAPD